MSDATSDSVLQGRFTFIDGLRGVAALGVLLFHGYMVLGGGEPTQHVSMNDFVPQAILLAFRNGDLGVQIFFVLSGFVIAHSIRGAAVTPGYFGNFALRRSIRLDPPYWSAIALVAAIKFGSNFVLTDRVAVIDWTLPQVVSNLLYIHGPMGYDGIIRVSWTLWLEIQFYVIFVLLVGVSQRVAMLGKGGGNGWAFFVIFAPLALASYAHNVTHPTYPGQIWFIHTWYMFFTGVMVYRVLEKSVRPVWLIVHIVAVLGLCFFQADARDPAMAALTGLVIYVVGVRGRLGTLMKGPVLQFFGRISYSLYLVHTIVLYSFVNVVARLLKPSMPVTIAALLGGMAVSIFVAWMLYLCVEKPSTQFAKRFRPRGAKPAASGFAARPPEIKATP